jgi:hypothetical protein
LPPSNGGEILSKHRVIRNPEIVVENPLAWNREIFDRGLITQPYDKGLARFTAKFDLSQPTTATIAIEQGCQFDHGTAIFFEQDKLRCALTDTLFGLSDDEAL